MTALKYDKTTAPIVETYTVSTGPNYGELDIGLQNVYLLVKADGKVLLDAAAKLC